MPAYVYVGVLQLNDLASQYVYYRGLSSYNIIIILTSNDLRLLTLAEFLNCLWSA